MSNFDRMFDIVVGHEGGFTADPEDPGNWTGGAIGAGTCRGTKFGISAAAYPSVDIANLTLDLAKSLYRRDYWQRIVGDRLPGTLALLVFDAAVNNGVGRANVGCSRLPWYRRMAVIGPGTLEAIAHAAARPGGIADLCGEFLAQRLWFMTSLPTWKPLVSAGRVACAGCPTRRSVKIPRAGNDPLLAWMPRASQRSGLAGRQHLGDPRHHRTAILQPVGDHVDDAFRAALQAPCHLHQAAAEDGAAEQLQQAGPDHDVGDAGFVLDGAEHDIAVARALAYQHHAGNREPSAIGLADRLSAAQHALATEQCAKEAHRV